MFEDSLFPLTDKKVDFATGKMTIEIENSALHALAPIGEEVNLGGVIFVVLNKKHSNTVLLRSKYNLVSMDYKNGISNFSRKLSLCSPYGVEKIRLATADEFYKFYSEVRVAPERYLVEGGNINIKKNGTGEFFVDENTVCISKWYKTTKISTHTQLHWEGKVLPVIELKENCNKNKSKFFFAYGYKWYLLDSNVAICMTAITTANEVKISKNCSGLQAWLMSDRKDNFEY